MDKKSPFVEKLSLQCGLMAGYGRFWWEEVNGGGKMMGLVGRAVFVRKG